METNSLTFISSIVIILLAISINSIMAATYPDDTSSTSQLLKTVAGLKYNARIDTEIEFL